MCWQADDTKSTNMILAICHGVSQAMITAAADVGNKQRKGKKGVKLACRENIAGRDFDGELGGRAAPSLSMGKIG